MQNAPPFGWGVFCMVQRVRDQISCFSTRHSLPAMIETTAAPKLNSAPILATSSPSV